MKIFRKEGDVIQIISFPNEPIEKGDYLHIEEPKQSRGLIVQVIDIQFANIPGILEDILRDVMTEESVEGGDYDPLDVSSQIAVLKDTKLLICKIRGSIEDGRPTSNVTWLPSRTSSKIEKFPIESLVRPARRKVKIGETKTNSEIAVDATAFDGRLNIITGRKGTGKSHLSKLLVTSLIEHGAPSFILDVNGEYVNLAKNKSGEFGKYQNKVFVLSPGGTIRFSLKTVGLKTFRNVLIFALDLPYTSARVFSLIWNQLEKFGKLNFRSLGEAIRNYNCNESVREALYARYNILLDSNLFTDDEQAAVDFNELSQRLANGGATVINLKGLSSTMRRVTVELLISKLTDLLSVNALKAVFLFAEEAHLYLRETYWDDIVTRMRHLGIFTTFITNQPDTVDVNIYRQADNIFLFNFTNEHDLDIVSKAAKIDAESVRNLVKDLPPHHCLVVGEAVQNFPLVVNVRPLDVETMGKTRYFFDDS